MHWKIFLNRDIGRVELWQGEVLVKSLEWAEARNTSQEILTAMQRILAEEGIQFSDVLGLKLELDLPPSATARRIAETFQNTYTTFVEETLSKVPETGGSASVS